MQIISLKIMMQCYIHVSKFQDVNAEQKWWRGWIC